jgi:hypothetical protein
MLPLPPVVAFTLAALGAAVFVKALAREWERVDAELEARGRATEQIPTLRRDSSGVYRPE